MTNITPDSATEHTALEAEVGEYLIGLGFEIASATYHTVMPGNVRDLLQNNYSPTALYLRGRSDRIAVRPDGVVFEWEAKTHGKSGRDMCVEALPLAHHILKARLDVRCLYVYRHLALGHEAGFWVHQLPPIRDLYIPTFRWSQQQIAWFGSVFNEIFPGTPVRMMSHVFGTGDPFLVIAERVIKTLPHWKDAIREHIEASAHGVRG